MSVHDLEELRARAARAKTDVERAALLRDLMAAHGAVAADGDEAQALRRLFVDQLDADLEEDRERFGRFLAEHVKPADFEAIEVASPDHAVALFQMLSRFRYDADESALRVQRHVESLLKSTLHRFEATGDLEGMIRLLRVAPPTTPSDPELVRLRGRAHLFEMERARLHRRVLVTYLVTQALLVLVVFPLLFINAENGRLQEELREVVDVVVDEGSGRQSLSYADGLYWSVITATSIGYGDITPRTGVGRLIAAVLGTMGVLTVGMTAGLVIYWLTPRRLE